MAWYMGNGPAALSVWTIGTGITFIVAFVYSSTRNKLGAMDGFNAKRFFL
jgi:sugar/nucleoside kinase (ribokinase family)